MSLNSREQISSLSRKQYAVFCRLHKELEELQQEITKSVQVFPSLALAYAGGNSLPAMEYNSTLEAFRTALGPSFRIMERADELGRDILRQGDNLRALASLIALHDEKSAGVCHE